MSKKAAIGMDEILFVTMGVLLLGLVLFFLFGGGGFKEKVVAFFSNIPSPGTNPTEREVIGNVRYDIQADSIQIYDGSTWNKFDKEMEFSTVGKVSEDELKSAFNGYYFDNSNRPKEETVFSNYKYQVEILGLSKSSTPEFQWYETYYPNNLLRDGFNWLFKDSTNFDTVNYKRGSLVLTVFNLDNSGKINSVGGFIFIDSDGTSEDSFKIEQTSEEASKWFGDTPQFSTSEKGTISQKAIVWRDSIFKQPLTVNEENFCATPLQGKYINIDLTKTGACDAA